MFEKQGEVCFQKPNWTQSDLLGRRASSHDEICCSCNLLTLFFPASVPMMIVSVDEVVKVSTKYSCLGWEVSSRRERVCTSVMLKSKMRRFIPDITFKMMQVVNIGRSSEGNIRRSVPSSLFMSGEIITTVERLASVGKVGRVLPLTGSKYPTKSSQHQFRRQR